MGLRSELGAQPGLDARALLRVKEKHSYLSPTTHVYDMSNLISHELRDQGSLS